MTAAPPVIGIVGNDVPRQLVLASGARPHRITGSWDAPIDPAAQELLGAADAVAVRILSELLGHREQIDALVICNDTQANLRLFYALRAIGWDTPLHLLDMPRDDTAPARRFAAVQYRALVEFCAEITGRTPDADALRSAAAEELALGRALERLRERRQATPSRCSGAAALDAIFEAARLGPAEAVAVVDAAGTDAAGTDATSAGTASAIRVHLTGSNHPDVSVYRAFEQRGVTVVSEDHDTGGDSWLGVVAEAETAEAMINSLIDAHLARTGSSTTAFAAERAALTADISVAAGAEAVVAFIRDLDEAPLWDLPDQAQQLAARGIRFLVRSHISLGDELAAVAAVIADVNTDGIVA